MKSDIKTFGKCIGQTTKSIQERAIAFLFFRAAMTENPDTSIREVAQDFKDSGLGNPNITRLRGYIARDSRTIKIGKDSWRIKSDEMDSIEQSFQNCLKHRKSPQASDSIIPSELMENTHSYLEKIVLQINGCYDSGFFDASGVMLRRLIETLIIEVFEHKKIEAKVKNSNGDFLMLNGLIVKLLNETSLHLSRNSKKGLSEVKNLGDQSAHSRRFLAKEADIDRLQPSVRTLVQELITLAGLQ